MDSPLQFLYQKYIYLGMYCMYYKFYHISNTNTTIFLAFTELNWIGRKREIACSRDKNRVRGRKGFVPVVSKLLQHFCLSKDSELFIKQILPRRLSQLSLFGKLLQIWRKTSDNWYDCTPSNLLVLGKELHTILLI